MAEEEHDGQMMAYLRKLKPGIHVSGYSSRNRQVPVLIGDSRFLLPRGWTVKIVPRPNVSHVDRYYYEPDTKKMFRSMREVERYLKGEKYTPRRRRLTTGKLADTPPFILPEGWVVEMVPREYQGRGSHRKHYYEPGTGRKFYSLVTVEKHLQEQKRENAPLSHTLELGNCSKEIKKLEDSDSDSDQPPKKIIWVLKDSGGLVWSPLERDTIVPHSVRNQWAFKFMRLMIGKNFVVPDLKRLKS